MYSYNNIPYYSKQTYNNRGNGDRFFGGGLILPFIAGGLIGGALSRPRFIAYPYQVPYNMPFSYTMPSQNAFSVVSPTMANQTYNNNDYFIYN